MDDGDVSNEDGTERSVVKGGLAGYALTALHLSRQAEKPPTARPVARETGARTRERTALRPRGDRRLNWRRPERPAGSP